MSVIGDQASKRSLILELSHIKDNINKQKTSLTLNEKKPLKKERLLQRVCCIKINRKWRIKKQIFVTTSVVFLIVLSIVMAFIGVFLNFFIKYCFDFVLKRGIFILQELTFSSKFKIILRVNQMKI